MENKVINIVVEQADNWHTCPFAEEIYGSLELCNCSIEETKQCAMDI